MIIFRHFSKGASAHGRIVINIVMNNSPRLSENPTHSRFYALDIDSTNATNATNARREELREGVRDRFYNFAFNRKIIVLANGCARE
jgi:hypothetical protein